MRKELTRTLLFEDFNRFSAWKSNQAVLEGNSSQDDPALDQVKNRVLKALTMITGRYPFFGEFVYSFRILYVPGNSKHVKTMATDGANIFINPTWTEKLSLQEIVFVLCHEILHNVMLHFVRRQNISAKPRKWNVAADHEINPMLVDEGLLTKDQLVNSLKGLYKDEYVGLAAEEIYKLLKTDKQPPPPPGWGDMNSGDDDQDPGESDDDDDNDSDGYDGEEDDDKEDGEGDGESGDGDDSEDGKDGKSGKSGEDKDGKEAGKPEKEQKGGSKTGSDGERKTKRIEGDGYEDQGIGGTITVELSRQIQRELGVGVDIPNNETVQKLTDQVRAVSTRVTMSGEKNLLAKGVARLTRPLIDWKSELRRFVGRIASEEKEFLGKRKHISRGLYVYDRKKGVPKHLGKAMIAVDTSGSMGHDRLKHVLGEVNGIIMAKKIKKTHLILFDHSIYHDDMLNQPPVFDFRLEPGGGTNYDLPLMKMLEEWKSGKMEMGVFITDGDEHAMNKDLVPELSKMSSKFIWLVINNPSFDVPFGTAIYATITEK